MILVVHPSFPAKTVQEFIAYAKANPGKLNFGNAGAGNVTHLTGEMFRSRPRSISSACRTRAAPSRSPACSASRSISCWKARWCCCR